MESQLASERREARAFGGGPGAFTPLSPQRMPDVASRAPASAGGPIDRVGMEHIELPARVRTASGEIHMVTAWANAYVSLDDPKAKGIHMSRLYLGLQAALEREVLSPSLVHEILEGFLESHRDLSLSAHVAIKWDSLIKRPALLSSNSGWRSYPVLLEGTIHPDGHASIAMTVDVTYSSTCPCSAALARQIIQKKFAEDFGNDDRVATAAVLEWLGSPEGICATPHSQRSHAKVTIVFAEAETDLRPVDLIDRIENALKTPVQAAVKREDEQEFARLNGSNLMFCEDAVRRMGAVLADDEGIVDWRVRAQHLESLHPHDAVAEATAGVPGGLKPTHA